MISWDEVCFSAIYQGWGSTVDDSEPGHGSMNDVTNIAGILIPSASPVFLSIVGIHVALGLACTVIGIVAMLSLKGPGRHPRFGAIYFWCLSGVFVSAASLAAVRWSEDYHLFMLGALSFAAAYFGRNAERKRQRNWPWFHIWGMGLSYILLLTAFYVDNGKNLPFWREFPPISFWFLPGAVGIPIVLYVVRRHPIVKRFSS